MMTQVERDKLQVENSILEKINSQSSEKISNSAPRNKEIKTGQIDLVESGVSSELLQSNPKEEEVVQASSAEHPAEAVEATDLADNPAEDNTNYVSYNTMNCDRGADDDMIFDTHMSSTEAKNEEPFQYEYQQGHVPKLNL